MNASLLRLMMCPFCGGKLTAASCQCKGDELFYGVLRCYCSRWPVVAGIPVFRKDAAGDGDAVLTLVEAGRFEDALKSCLSIRFSNGSDGTVPWIKHTIKRTLTSRWVGNWPGSLPGIGNRLAEFVRSEQFSALLNQQNHITARQFLAAHYLNRKDNYDYFLHRFSQPRYLVALSLTSTIRQPDGPLLDLACGCGHLTRALLAQAEGQPVIGVDRSFFPLYVAKRWVAPGAHFVCCDADQTFPFSDSTFAAAVCSDAFHYFVAKTACFHECERLTSDKGFFLLIWVHNAQVPWPFDGVPLAVDGYQSLAAHMPHRLVADRSILAGYLRKEGPRLAEQVDLTQLADERTLSLVVSHRDEIFRDYGPFDLWPHTNGRLSLNPLYVREGPDSSGTVSWRKSLPSAFFELDHPETRSYLPDRVDIPPSVLESLEKQERTPEIEKLIANCVIVGFPEAYF